ncbi:unnamed protein product [Arabis nemorensis]|uniref:CXXC motif containing zinc binding protein n=1 Tax=Arabis nemorensis TaxID=586526 RepID=A0A565CAA8_9BRAS|nr:unnamed protein product [Arabis nemorensis]
MVNYVLKIIADLENLTNLQPSGGCDDANFPYLFKLKCERCGEVTQKETCVTLNETFTPPGGRGTCHLVQKCKFCGREGNVTMIPGKGRPLTLEDSEAGEHAPLMVFDCRGYEPIDFGFGGYWKAEAAESGTKFDEIDLSSGEEFTEYDEKGECGVMISNFRASFSVTK